MSAVAQWCDECGYSRFGETGMTCAMGHRPRFYRPKSSMGGYGWKRRCVDAVPRPAGRPDASTEVAR